MTNLCKYIKYIEILLTKTIKRCIIITIPVRLWNKNITLGGQSLMNLVEQKLSALPIGSPIRFTQSNGQIIEGVLSENDKTSTLEIIVTAKVTLMYSQIAGIEESNAFGKNVIPVQVSDTAIVSSTGESLKANEIITEEEKKNESEIKSDIKFTCTKNELKSAFKPMDNSIKTKFSPILNKALSAIDNHDESKFEECINALWNIINDNGYEIILK